MLLWCKITTIRKVTYPMKLTSSVRQLSLNIHQQKTMIICNHYLLHTTKLDFINHSNSKLIPNQVYTIFMVSVVFILQYYIRFLSLKMTRITIDPTTFANVRCMQQAITIVTNKQIQYSQHLK